MDLDLLLALLPALRRAALGRRVERVLPAGRHGLHIAFEGSPLGLRLELETLGGIALPTRSHPPRVRGGRSHWTDLAAVADRDWAGRELLRLGAATGERALVLEFEEGGRLTLAWGRRGASLHAEDPAWSEPFLLSFDKLRTDALRASAAIPVEETAPLAEALRRLAGALAVGEAEEEDLRAVLPALSRRRAAFWLAAARGEPARLEPWFAALAGEPVAAEIALPAGHDGEADAALDGRLGLELLPAGGGAALEEVAWDWFCLAEASAALAERRAALARIVAKEEKRVARARRAVAREEERAPEPAALRRRADALLAAGPRAETLAEGYRVPDPWEQGASLVVPPDPPGASLHETAERIYRRARKAERGETARLERAIELEERAAQLAELADALTAPDAGRDAALSTLEAELESLGIAARPEHRITKKGGRAKRGRPEPAEGLSVYRSPNGFTVLVGRSAQQNERLTFRVAAPEDLWFHVLGMPGSHVLLRVEGRSPGEEDRLFAAGLAAAFSRAPEGEAVDVHVARRKHLRRPKGGATGAALVRKSETLRIVTGKRPSR